METEKLYHEDPYLGEFEAMVLRVDGNEVVLDRTAFYPEGGGQAGDTGVIGGVRVADTQIRDGIIVHILEAPPSFTAGDRVECRIDWERRHRIMRLHSAAHIMEFFLRRRLGEMERVGSHVDDRKDRSDYAYEGRLPADELKKVEEDTNRFLAEGREIRIRPDPERPGIRIWSCGPIEMPCGGTHVRSTREIGAVRLRRRNPGRGVERVETTLAED
ncbi:alanyl-tRNA editing protein [Candidatus Bathyarchaeota archaeon]|nr:MAG: alanyl-tRNA editing protein [Candidatus Bathyarchaeota archaeon]